MRARGDGVVITEPIETHVNRNSYAQSAAATDDEQRWAPWEAWMAGHKALFRDELMAIVAHALALAGSDLENKLAAQVKRIDELELRLATAIGSIDVLRGGGVPGSLHIRGTYDPDTVYNHLDVVAFNGASWVARKDCPGDLPGPHWQLLSAVGKRGPRREPGPPGTPGKRFPQARVWRDQVHYAGDVVVYEGSTYQAVNDTGKPPTFANDWTLLAVAGHDGRSLRPRGSFEADVEYRALDVVLCNGSSYVALCDAPGECPSNKWQLLAAPGRDGRDGATGPRGERGERGLIGPRGEPAPRITGWRVDHAAYTAVPLLSEGSEGASLELRSMFKQFLDEVAPRA
jgi:hypothetical protein